MIDKASQTVIDAAKLANRAATERYHAGHHITTVRWDKLHTIKLCKQCGCTVEDVKKNPTSKTSIGENFGIYKSKQPSFAIGNNRGF